MSHGVSISYYLIDFLVGVIVRSGGAIASGLDLHVRFNSSGSDRIDGNALVTKV